MTSADDPLAYWDGGPGAGKTFTHPLPRPWLEPLDRDVRVLDYGCGYGRTVAELGALGFTRVCGADPSAALVARGRAEHPGLDLAVMDDPPRFGRADGSFDAVLLLAVLTCVPEDGAQRALVAELHRLLAPGGLLVVSDLLLQDDPYDRDRYDAYARTHQGTAPFGVFTTADGGVFRHHDAEHLRGLLTGGFEPVGERRITVPTMNGREARGVQLAVRKR